MNAPAATEAAPQLLSPDFYQRLFESAGLAIFVCDPLGRIQEWNTLGREVARLHGRETPASMRDLLPTEALHDFARGVTACLAGERSRQFRMRIESDSGPRDYVVWVTPVRDDLGRIDRVCLWLHDVTERVLERRGERKQERLSTLGSLAGAMAHHYNNLLCGVGTSLEYAMNLNNVIAMRKALRRTAEAAARAAQLTRQLLAFAQADHRASDQADLTETVLLYFDQQEEPLRARRIELEIGWEPMALRPVPREPFLAVLRSLVENAVEAMPGGGTLRVYLGREQRSALLRISDTGVGLKPDHLERIFEPFFTTKGELAEGQAHKAGMGLAMAHGFIRDMGGTITASNEPTGGARFEIRLPIEVGTS
jgi:signal transduction histidine kinase